MKHQPVTAQGSPPVPSEATASPVPQDSNATPLILKITWVGHVCPEIYKPNHSESLNHFPCPVVKVESFPSRYELSLPSLMIMNILLSTLNSYLFQNFSRVQSVVVFRWGQLCPHGASSASPETRVKMQSHGA